MKFKLGLLLSTFVLFLTASEASAETKTLKGGIQGDPGSKVIIKIQRVGGSPFRVTSFAFRRVSFSCFGETPSGRVSGDVGRMKIDRGTNPFGPGTTNVYFSGRSQTTKDRKIAVFITGIANRKATKTSGNFGFSFGDGCTIDETDGFSRFIARS